ncbi:hypothetical protein DU508_01015 [Pedobacter chinensis]|uniref:Uncharacterized protein n=1 Tax=Pedobacter chinensis TaxID=2282421 RepID=A0A369Q6R1_9SPHI|nr:hypothetical protein DU508_01015 [Pedobacter chinensis]
MLVYLITKAYYYYEYKYNILLYKQLDKFVLFIFKQLACSLFLTNCPFIFYFFSHELNEINKIRYEQPLKLYEHYKFHYLKINL